MKAFGVDGGGGNIEADELGDVECGTGLGPVVTAGEMRAGWREDVAAVEGRREFCADHPVGVGDLASGFDAVAILNEGEEAVVGDHEELADFGFGR